MYGHGDVQGAGVGELLQGTITAGLLSFEVGTGVPISDSDICLGPKPAVKALTCFLQDLDDLQVRSPPPHTGACLLHGSSLFVFGGSPLMSVDSLQG